MFRDAEMRLDMFLKREDKQNILASICLFPVTVTYA